MLSWSALVQTIAKLEKKGSQFVDRRRLKGALKAFCMHTKAKPKALKLKHVNNEPVHTEYKLQYKVIYKHSLFSCDCDISNFKLPREWKYVLFTLYKGSQNTMHHNFKGPFHEKLVIIV